MRRRTLITMLAVASMPAAAQTHPESHHKHKAGWEEKFAEANTTKDGHLTLEQAQSGYPDIVKHFSEIDTDNKGYVTLDDMHAWHKAQATARHLGHTKPAEDPLRPRPAYQRASADPMTVNTGTTQIVPMSRDGAMSK